jgi:hypothetical protein
MCFSLCLLALIAHDAEASQVQPQGQREATSVDLSPEEAARLAEHFAPILVFHPDEKYFPASPLFPVESRTGADSTLGPESFVSLLRTPEARIDDYKALTNEEKAGLATVYYRAYSPRNSPAFTIILEYWFYYVHNDYRVRGSIFPFWVDGSHPNDLEHVHLVLRAVTNSISQPRFRTASGEVSLVVDEVYASAHEGKIPGNRYKYPESRHTGPTRFLVERGSHALAPDIDEDGVFTPGKDGESGYKVLWGIRDRGFTWPRYKASYMDRRTAGRALIFFHEKAPHPADLDSATEKTTPRFSYRLVPVQSLEQSFAQISLTDSERKQAFEKQVHWFTRVFGRDNGRSDKLLVPSDSQIEAYSRKLERAPATERDLLLGAVFNLEDPGLFIGGRYLVHGSVPYLPDLVFEVNGTLTERDTYLTSQFLLSYPIDGATKIMGGRALVTDSLRFTRSQWDWIGIIEFRLGEMRISAASRSTGPLRSASKEFRLFYSF